MKTISKPSTTWQLVLACIFLLFLSSCAVMLPVTATSNPVTPTSKVGTSTATNVLGFWINAGRRY